MLSLLAELNFTSPTRIQQQAIPKLLVCPFDSTHDLQHPGTKTSVSEAVISVLPALPAAYKHNSEANAAFEATM